MRRARGILTVFSLLLCVAVVVLWVRSFRPLIFFTDQVAYDRDQANFLAYSWKGELCFVLASNPSAVHGFPLDTNGSSSSVNIGDLEPMFSASRKRYLGFHFGSGRNWDIRGYTYDVLIVPDWFLILLLSLPSAWMLWRWRYRRRRANAQLCVACGYDLRASPDRCPECGAIRGA